MKRLMFSVAILGLVTASILVVIAIDRHSKSQPRCIRSHTTIEHREPYTNFIYAGKVMIPMTHPARDVEVTVCDEYEREEV